MIMHVSRFPNTAKSYSGAGVLRVPGFWQEPPRRGPHLEKRNESVSSAYLRLHVGHRFIVVLHSAELSAGVTDASRW